MGNEIALLCTLAPANLDKRARCLDLLRKGAREYYRRPSAKCTTWSYFTGFRSSDPTICGLEIYTDKQALTEQLNDHDFFQAYHETVEREKLYSAPEKLVAWYQAGGFVARETHAKPFGRVIVSCSSFVCRDRDGVLAKLRSFADWVRSNEPDVLTYILFTRPKAAKEVLVFVRYKDQEALNGHSRAPEHVKIVKALQTQLTNDMAKSTSLWEEVEDSFVSDELGAGDEMGRQISRL